MNRYKKICSLLCLLFLCSLHWTVAQQKEKRVEDSSKKSSVKVSSKKAKGVMTDENGNDLTPKIKKFFLNGKEVPLKEMESIDSKEIKSVRTSKEGENGKFDLHITTFQKGK